MCVLGQIKDTKSRFETFVSNRKNKINANTEDGMWGYVDTDQNPADVVSRGLMPDDPKWGLFTKGPDFLYQEESTWEKWPRQIRLSW